MAQSLSCTMALQVSEPSSGAIPREAFSRGMCVCECVCVSGVLCVSVEHACTWEARAALVGSGQVAHWVCCGPDLWGGGLGCPDAPCTPCLLGCWGAPSTCRRSGCSQWGRCREAALGGQPGALTVPWPSVWSTGTREPLQENCAVSGEESGQAALRPAGPSRRGLFPYLHTHFLNRSLVLISLNVEFYVLSIPCTKVVHAQLRKYK